MASVEEIFASMPETYYAGVVGTMVNLEKLIKNDENTEMTLLLQHPYMLQMWMLLESNIADIEKGKEISKQKGEEAYLNYLLMVRDIMQQYKKLGNLYFEAFQNVCGQYGNWLVGDWISGEAKDFYLEQDYSMEGYDINEEFLQRTNSRSLNARCETFDALSNIQDVLASVIVSGHEKLKVIVPDDKELKELTICVIRDFCKTFYTQEFQKNLRHEAVRLMGGEKYTRVTPENWIDLLTNEDKLIELGKSRLVLKECQDSKAEDARFEFYGEDRCKILDDSQDLMDIILRVNYGLELFDLEGALDNYNLLSALNENNLDLFCEMFLRRNVMLGMIEPELKKEFETWLNGPEMVDDDVAAMSRERQTIYDSIMKYINKGDWKAPATTEKVKDFVDVVLGREPSRLDANDRQMPEKLWKLLTSGRTTCKKDGNTRLEITWAKICGLFYSYHFFYGEPHHILKKIFGEQKYLSSHFSKGKKPDDKGYREILPFLEKYIEKIIKT